MSVDKLQGRASTIRSSKEANEAVVSVFSNTQLVVEMLLMWEHLPVDSSIFIINQRLVNWSVQCGELESTWFISHTVRGKIYIGIIINRDTRLIAIN